LRTNSSLFFSGYRPPLPDRTRKSNPGIAKRELGGTLVDHSATSEDRKPVRLRTKLKFLNAASYVALSRADYQTACRLGERALVFGRQIMPHHAESLWPLIQLAPSQLGLRDFPSAKKTFHEIESALPSQATLLRSQLEIVKAKLAIFQNGPGQTPASQDTTLGEGVPGTSLGEYHGLLAVSKAASGASNAAIGRGKYCGMLCTDDRVALLCPFRPSYCQGRRRRDERLRKASRRKSGS
jgi:hypothetical protein